ncbi:MAG TPA: MgtC/SapB family protein [Actinomycetota bacterium]|nr:MgtC/SapB family protein [Actinomycetota bacterium]
MPNELELSLRLVLAAALGGAIGIEREISDQPAGFRTHMLVSLGACLFAVVSAYGFDAFLEAGLAEQVRFDPSRLAAQIVTGIGFLGAGAIIRYGMTVRGLTTAASLWVVAAIGTAVGIGTYIVSLVTTVITLISLYGLKRVRGRLVRGLKKEHEEFLIEAGRDVALDGVLAALSDAAIRVDHVRVEDERGEDARQIVLFLAMPPGRDPEEVAALLSSMEGIRGVDWTR